MFSEKSINFAPEKLSEPIKMKNLVIVESPAKAKTIEKFLGKDYKVMSSYGHIRDLVNKEFDSAATDDFKPDYEIPADKKELVKKLKAAAKDAEMVWLASDEDREGEAIAWHLAEVLKLKPENTRRIVFHEITKPAILAAIENPRTIDRDRVNAQQARRVLDRIVGFELSPVLWRKIKPALSAGRVQSVAVRLICEREKEINTFKSEPYFRVNALFNTLYGPLRADLDKRFADEATAAAFLRSCIDAKFTVGEVTVRPVKRSPAPPFTTSTLQQEASRRLGLSVNRTMMIAQKLYESGLITYMRTDSLNLSKLALADIASTIKQDLGEQYLQVRNYHTSSKGAQEAHEAIRPTYISNRTIDGDEQEKRLYDLIWKRTVASQMADARLLKTHVDIHIAGAASEDMSLGMTEKFEATGETVEFEGFLKAYGDMKDAEGNLLPTVMEGENLVAAEIAATERFTQPPARYNEATLVKKMEELGIGRPSTYAPTISTIQSRDYVARGEKEAAKRNYDVLTLEGETVKKQTLTENTGSDKGKLVPTDVGMVVNDFLTEYFPDILDYNFTARIEEKFDEIAEGKLAWKHEIQDFYGTFHPTIEETSALRMEHRVGERVLGTDPKSGRQVSVKIGRFGPVAQIGEASDEEKPLFASLQAGQSLQTLTLEEALKLFELPRTLGEFEGKKVEAAVGRFGPYIRHAGAFVSIPKTLTPQGITLEEAIALIEKKRIDEANKFIKDFPEIPGLQILNGRFGPYMAYKPEGAKKAVNYKIPKTTDPHTITADDARKLMAEADAAPKRPRPVRKSAKK